jgi:hypothetical protein
MAGRRTIQTVTSVEKSPGGSYGCGMRITQLQWQEKHGDDPFMYSCCKRHSQAKIEIEGKCCNGHPDHELKVNSIIFIQTREEFETMNK